MFSMERIFNKYTVKKLGEQELEQVYQLCQGNPQYYQYCPPFVTKESIRADMNALPPRKMIEDKYYLGFYDGDSLVAVMDLILKFPKEETAFVGFFMMNAAYQGRGIGTAIMEEMCACLKEYGFYYVRLGFAKGNPQSEHFWMKNGFQRTGVEVQNEGYTVVVLEKQLRTVMNLL